MEGREHAELELDGIRRRGDEGGPVGVGPDRKFD